jgi:gliding motility-associated-like protein
MKKNRSKKTIILVLIFLNSFSFDIKAQFVDVYNNHLKKISWCSVDCGDFDNDGLSDILITGWVDILGVIGEIYKNNGNGFELYFTFEGVKLGDCKWADIDNDNDLDFAVIGTSWNNDYISKIYKNNNGEFLEVYNGSLAELNDVSLDWGDYNNDDYVDLVISGYRNWENKTIIYKNTGESFTEVNVGNIVGVSEGSVDWGDYNNDGNIDLLISGKIDAFGNYCVSKIYKNNGNIFVEEFLGTLTPVIGEAVWGDFDNDDDLDIFICGKIGDYEGIAKLYRNDGNDFTEVFTETFQTINCRTGTAEWGDYNNDGLLDLLLSCYYMNKLFKNTGNGFQEVFNNYFYCFSSCDTEWFDFDNDDDLDIIISGTQCSGEGVPNTKIYKNRTPSIAIQPEDAVSCLNNSTFFVAKGTGGILSYQWQFSDDSGNNFYDITDNEIYQNSNSDTLFITNTDFSLNNYKFRCILTYPEITFVSDTVTLNVFELTSPIPNQTQLPIVVGECLTYIDTIPTATNCYGTFYATTSDTLFYSNNGTYIINWNYNDGHGNISNQTQKVIIQTPPPAPDVINLPDIIGECSVTIDSIPTATNCFGNFNASTNAPLLYSESGNYIINWQYNDGYGNTSIQTQNVIVEDTFSPIPDLTSLPDIIFECNSSPIPFPTATDNCKGIITATTSEPMFYDSLGTYLINWQFDDNNGNIVTQQQKVIINDITMPEVECAIDETIIISALDTIYYISDYEFDPICYDNCHISYIINNVNNQETLNGFQFHLGINSVLWTVFDLAGNYSTCESNIIVLKNLDEIELFIPDFFTPNSDGINDTWEIGEIEYYTEAIITIYDRWGKKLISYSSSEHGWDGTYNGKPIISDSYWYIIDLKHNNKIFTGFFTLKR